MGCWNDGILEWWKNGDEEEEKHQSRLPFHYSIVPVFQTAKETVDMKKIQILGAGCVKCKTLTANAEAAVKALGIEAQVEKVEKITEIMKFNVMMTPALVVDGVVKSAGKVLGPEEIKKMLE